MSEDDFTVTGDELDACLDRAERAEAALDAIIAHADMPAGESWEQAYIEVTSIARDARMSEKESH
jgi:hypothetical protein